MMHRQLLLLLLLRCCTRSRQGHGGSAQHCSGSKDKFLDCMPCMFCERALRLRFPCKYAIGERNVPMFYQDTMLCVALITRAPLWKIVNGPLQMAAGSQAASPLIVQMTWLVTWWQKLR